MLKRVGFKGRGGTSSLPVFDKVKEMKLRPHGMIFLTDMMTDFPAERPPYPVLWVSVDSDVTAPFGETIRITLDQEA